MTTETETRPTITRTIDARGSFCPGPLMELIRAIREGAIGDVIDAMATVVAKAPHARLLVVGARRPEALQERTRPCGVAAAVTVLAV